MNRDTRILAAYFLAFGALTLSLARWITPYMAVATGAYFALLAGFALHRSSRTLHATAMLAGIGLDLALVLTLQYQRHAVQKALEFSLTWLQQLHILFSTLALVLYFPVVVFGIRLLTGRARYPRERVLHVRIAVTALFFRSLGFILMFSLLFNRR